MAKILVVDDDESYVEFLKELLTLEKYDVTGMTSGLDAVKLMRKNKFDLFILDVVMPDVNGFQLCKEIRESKRNHDSMVVMVTGKRMSTEDLIDGLEMGADEYLMKPVSTGELLARVKAMLRIRELQQEILRKERKSAWIKGMRHILATFGQHLAESSAKISTFSDFGSLATEEQVREFHEMVSGQTRVISTVLESLQIIIRKIDNEADDISENEILKVEETLKERLEKLN